MAYSLADSAPNEDDVRNAKHGLSADEVAQHASDHAPEERAERCRGRDEFLLYPLAVSGARNFCSPYLLTRGQFCRPKITSDRHESARNDPSVVPCDQQH